MASFIERLEIWIDAKANGAVAGIRQVETAAKNAGVETGKLDTAFQRLGLSGNIAGGVLNTVVGTAAAAAAVEMGKLAYQSAHAFEQTGESILKFSQISGLSAEQSSRWVEVAGDYQVGADKISLAVGRLAKNIGTGSEEFAKFGIETKRNADGSVNLEQTLFNVINAMNRTSDETQQAAIGNAAFGRGWQDLSNLIAQGSDAIASSLAGVNAGQVFTAEDLQSAEAYRLATDRLGDSVEALKLELGAGVAPVIAGFDNALAGMLESADTAARAVGFEGLGGAIGDLITLMVPGASSARALGEAMSAAGTVTLLKAQTDEEAARSAYELAAAQQRVAFTADQAASALRQATAASQSMAGLYSGIQGDMRDIAEIQERLANGGQTLAEIQDAETESAKKGGSAARGLADAQRAIEDAQRRVADQTERLTEAEQRQLDAVTDVEDATRKLAQAQERLNDARKYDPSETIIPAEANAKAQRSVQEAQMRVADATDQAAQAQADYEALIESGTGTVQQINRADRDRRRAQLDLEQAQQDVIEAQREQIKTAGDLTAVDLQLKSSSGDLEQATKDVEGATRDLATAQDKQKQAADGVRDAQRSVEDATRAVEDAQRRLTEQQTASDGYSASKHQPTLKTEAQLREELNKKYQDAIAKSLALGIAAGDEQTAQQTLSDQLNGTTTPAWLATNLAIEAQAKKLRELADGFGPGTEGYNRLQALAGLQEQIIQQNNARLQTIGNYPGSLDLLAPEELAKINGVGGSTTVNVQVDGQNLIKILLPGIMSAVAAQG